MNKHSKEIEMNIEAMRKAIEESKYNKKNNYKKGGPFGACIVKDGKILVHAHNTVLKDNDPTCHAEINAIRKASKKLKTHNLEGCILYTSCEPCPMCLSAIIWANIKEVYYANTKKDASNIGFIDDTIYEYIKGNNEIINLNHIENIEAKDVFNNFKEIKNKKMY